MAPSFVKVFAAPGIDSHISEQGVFNSGAGLAPDHATLKTPPYDWGNEVETYDHNTGRLVGNFAATQAPNAASMKIRKRGISPWGGNSTHQRGISHMHPGGIADMNPGADSRIAGGSGAASSMCRVNRVTDNSRGMKLPVLPQETARGGAGNVPAGGGGHDSLAAPLKPKVPGWPTIFSFTSKKG